MSQVANAALRRIAKPPVRRRSGGPRPDTVLRAALLRASQEVPGLLLTVSSIGWETVEPARALDGVEPGSMLLRLRADQGRTGVALVPPALVQGMIEVQITGSVTARRAAPRSSTAADAALASRILDPWFASLLRAGQEPGLPSALASDGLFADPRSALLALGEVDRTALKIALDFNEGKRTGELVLLLPEADAPKAAPETQARADVSTAISPIPTEVEVVLCTLKLPLSRIGALEAGDIIPLAEADVRDVVLRLPDGERIATGHLGQSRGMRAVRVHLDRPPSGQREREGREGSGGEDAEEAALPDLPLPV